MEALQDGWWNDESLSETVFAFATWRAQIDQNAHDPREELAFQYELTAYARALHDLGGGVARAWQPGAPPEDWTEQRR